MDKPTLIIINGLSATGKSTLIDRITSEFHLPIFSMDVVKEYLFDELGTDDTEWSAALGKSSRGLIYMSAKEVLAVGQSCIVEGLFEPEENKKNIEYIQKSASCNLIQIICTADNAERIQRWNDRVKSGDRHPGHNDEILTGENYVNALEACDPVVPLEAPLLCYRSDAEDAEGELNSLISALKELL